MTRESRRTGYSLLLAGAAGVVFFVVTDPRFGAGNRPGLDYVESVVRGTPGTLVGIAGSILTTLIGLWLMMRRLS